MTTPDTTLRRPAAWFWQVEPAKVEMPIDGDYTIGLLIVALLPAVFWPLAVKGVSLLFGFSVSWIGLAILGSVIFAFLGTIYAVIARRRR